MANRAGREQTPLQTAASVACRSPTAPRQVQCAKRDVKRDLCNSKETYINQKRPTVFKLQHLSPAVLQPRRGRYNVPKETSKETYVIQKRPIYIKRLHRGIR